jgi:hypothetical protein
MEGTGMEAIGIGETFEIRERDGKHTRVDTLRREANENGGNGPLRVTHLTCSDVVDMKPYTFATEPD